MIEIAIVEDEDREAETLMACLERFRLENQEEFRITRYRDALAFLEERKSFDIIFMDIMLPNLSGMEAAARLRKFNKWSTLIFVTTMAQFAIRGYEVDAFDYIVKPVTYERLMLKLRKVVKLLGTNSEKMITVNDPNGLVRISVDDLYYIEVRGHKLTYHTLKGTCNEYGNSLNVLESMLKERNFMRCNACYLVNPRYIERVNTKELLVFLTNGESLKISQPRRKNFMNELTNWLGQGKC